MMERSEPDDRSAGQYGGEFPETDLEILQHTPDLASLEILRRVREAGYKGGKTALYALVASLRPKSSKPPVRFEGRVFTKLTSCALRKDPKCTGGWGLRLAQH
jgi:hypothetical protein